jgi:hypothetical protein
MSIFTVAQGDPSHKSAEVPDHLRVISHHPRQVDRAEEVLHAL